MAWTYSDYDSQATDALRLARLRLHKREVTDKIHEDYAIAGRSIQTAHLTNYLATIVEPRLRELEAREGTTSTASSSGAFIRVRPL